jgi:hypothetical protein
VRTQAPGKLSSRSNRKCFWLQKPDAVYYVPMLCSRLKDIWFKDDCNGLSWAGLSLTVQSLRCANSPIIPTRPCKLKEDRGNVATSCAVGRRSYANEVQSVATRRKSLGLLHDTCRSQPPPPQFQGSMLSVQPLRFEANG